MKRGIDALAGANLFRFGGRLLRSPLRTRRNPGVISLISSDFPRTFGGSNSLANG
jgi:hypothetical protein